MQNLHTVDTVDGWTREDSYGCGIDHSSPFYDEATDSELVAFHLERGAAIPTRKTAGASGYDLYTKQDETFHKMRITWVDTGVRVESPVPMLVMARSSLIKRGLMLANSVGLIDEDYRGTIKLPLIYLGTQDEELGDTYTLPSGTALCQLVFFSAYKPTSYVALGLSTTDRGEGAFGSTDQ